MADSDSSTDEDVPETSPSLQNKSSSKKKKSKKSNFASKNSGPQEQKEKRAKKRKSKEPGSPPHSVKSMCCKKRCIHKIAPETRERLLGEYQQHVSRGAEHGQSFLTRYIIYREAFPIDGNRRNATFYYRLPYGEGNREEMRTCKKAFVLIFEITEWTLRDALGEEKKQYDGAPAKKSSGDQQEDNGIDDVMIVETVPASSNTGAVSRSASSSSLSTSLTSSSSGPRCTCINSQPVHFNADTGTTVEQFQGMCNWFLYRIRPETLKALYEEGYDSVLSLQSIVEEDLSSFRQFGIKMAQVSLLRRFVQSLNCPVHPPVHPTSRSALKTEPGSEVQGSSRPKASQKPAAASTISRIPKEENDGGSSGHSGERNSQGSMKNSRQTQNPPESVKSPVDMGHHPSPPAPSESHLEQPPSRAQPKNNQPSVSCSKDAAPVFAMPQQPVASKIVAAKSLLQPNSPMPKSPLPMSPLSSYLVASPKPVDSPFARDLVQMYASPTPSPSSGPNSPATAGQQRRGIARKSVVTETLPVLSPASLTEYLGASPKPNSPPQQPAHAIQSLNSTDGVTSRDTNTSTEPPREKKKVINIIDVLRGMTRIPNASPPLASRPSSVSSTLSQLQRFIQNASPRSNISTPSPAALLNSPTPSPTSRPESTSSTRLPFTPDTNIIDNMNFGRNTSVNIWNVQNNMAVMSPPPQIPPQRQNESKGLDILSSAPGTLRPKSMMVNQNANQTSTANQVTATHSVNVNSTDGATSRDTNKSTELSREQKKEINEKLFQAANLIGGLREVSKCLHQGADVNYKHTRGPWSGETPLHMAAQYGRQEISILLLKKGADVQSKEKSGETPLHMAADNGHYKMCDVLLMKGADVHSKNKSGKTPLHLAAYSGHEEVCDVLMRKGADVHSKDNSGATPLHKAAAHGRQEVCDILLMKGADVNSKDKSGKTPLHMAAYHGHQEVCGVLLMKGADVHSKDRNGDTPLHQAACKGHHEVCDVLLKNDADVQSKNKGGQTSLHLAADSGHQELCDVLLEKGADVHSKDRLNGNTPLHLAAQNGHQEVCGVLLMKGADVNSKNKSGKTPLDLAAEDEHQEICNMLVRNCAEGCAEQMS